MSVSLLYRLVAILTFVVVGNYFISGISVGLHKF